MTAKTVYEAILLTIVVIVALTLNIHSSSKGVRKT